MSKLYSIQDYLDYLEQDLQFELSEVSKYVEFDEWVESVNPHLLHDEEAFLEWFYSLQEGEYDDFAERLWKNSKLDDEIEQAQEKTFITNLEIDRGEMLLENLQEMSYACYR